MENKSQKVFVAMSGGVDSSVATALLKKQRLDVVGVFFKPWSPGSVNSNCQWEQDRRDAMRVCAKLQIPFKTWDFSKEYEQEVVQYMVDSYRSGITPNPDVMCNKEIKFGLFLKRALAEGADYIATGHYVRLKPEFPISNFQFPNKFKIQNKKNCKLLKGIDKNKDQSYFLWTLTQKQLKHCLFPIGDYVKPEVRKLAKKFGLPNYDKKDSQGVCFIGQLDMKKFLKNYIKPKRGEIRLVDGNIILGWHDGVYYYTIGQRHGLNIKDGGGPYFVVSKDIKKNIIYVTNTPLKLNIKNQTRAHNKLSARPSTEHITSYVLGALVSKIEKVSWVGTIPELPLDCQIKIRYRSKSVSAIVTKNTKSKTLFIKFKKPVRALTPGQSAVFYRGQEVLGGGVII